MMNGFRLFGGAKVSRAGVVAAAEHADDLPEYALSRTSQRLAHLPPHERELAPHILGAVAHTDRFGSLAQQARLYRTTCLVLAGATLVMSIGLVRMAVALSDTRVVPYVVQVDRHGFVVPVGAMERAADADPRVVMASLARWVRALRTVTGVEHAQRELIAETFSYVGKKSVAAAKVNEWFAQHPLKGARRVDVAIQRVAPLSRANEYSIEWTEEAAEPTGEHPVKTLHSAIVSVVLHPTQKLSDIIRNPLGVFVEDFSISQLK